MSKEDSNDWNEDEVWEETLKLGDALDAEEEESKDFNYGDLYEDERIR